jgi:transcriptional regulator with XRE-family HTH domain
MKLESFRKRRELTQKQAAAELGLLSKGYFSRLESGKAPMPLKLALRIQAWSGGKVTAAELVSPEQALLLRQVAGEGRAEL